MPSLRICFPPIQNTGNPMRPKKWRKGFGSTLPLTPLRAIPGRRAGPGIKGSLRKKTVNQASAEMAGKSSFDSTQLRERQLPCHLRPTKRSIVERAAATKELAATNLAEFANSHCRGFPAALLPLKKIEQPVQLRNRVGAGGELCDVRA